MMERENQNQHHLHHQTPPPPQSGNGNGSCGGMVYVKVMTDEQLETLRKQIAIYASICEQLVQMHKTLTTHQDLAGVRLGNLYCDPFLTSAGQRITARQRWTPTPVQLQVLESIFDQGNGTPSKQKIKEITSELSQHGQISETNVYNWFQNRRARSKRKQVVTPNNADSEAETEADSPKDIKTKPESFQSQQNPGHKGENTCFQSPEISSELHFLDPQANKVEIGGLGQMSFFEGMLSNQRNDHLIGKMEVQGSYDLYEQAEDYNLPG